MTPRTHAQTPGHKNIQTRIHKPMYFGLGMAAGAALIMLSGFFTPGNFSLLKSVEFYIKNDYVYRDLDTQQLERGAIEGYLKTLRDPYTRYLDPASRELMQMQVQGTILGIGITAKRIRNGLEITDIIPGGTAQKAGLRIGDVLVAIEGIDLSTQYQYGVLQSILEHTTMRVTVLRGSQRFPLVIARNTATHESAVSSQIIDGVGYIQLRSFESITLVQEMEAALADLRKANCTTLVLDLRKNTGGLLRNAVRVAGLFLREGVVVITVDRYGTRTPMSVEGKPPLFPFPIVILVDRKTASAAEVLAGALRDHKQALTVGAATYGKAAIQKMVVLPDGSALLYTSARYLTPSGLDIHQKGIPIDKPLAPNLSESDIMTQVITLAKTSPRRS